MEIKHYDSLLAGSNSNPFRSASLLARTLVADAAPDCPEPTSERAEVELNQDSQDLLCGSSLFGAPISDGQVLQLALCLEAPAALPYRRPKPHTSVASPGCATTTDIDVCPNATPLFSPMIGLMMRAPCAIPLRAAT